MTGADLVGIFQKEIQDGQQGAIQSNSTNTANKFKRVG